METIIANTVAEALDNMGFNYRQDGEIFKTVLSDDEVDFRINILADDENELLLIIGYFPVRISKMNLEKMCKVINELNSQYMVGCFVIDPEDGELTFRLANNVDGGAINEQIFRMCYFQVGVRMRNTYQDIMKAMYGGEQYTFTFGDSAIDDQRKGASHDGNQSYL